MLTHAFPRAPAVVFLERLQTHPPLPAPHIVHLSNVYALASTENAEIRFRFYQVALATAGSEAARTFATHAVNWASGLDGSGVVKVRSFAYLRERRHR